MKTLHLIIKKKWYDMIASEEKPEEYRDITEHYISRIIDTSNYPAESPNQRHILVSDIVYDLTINKHPFKEVIQAYYGEIINFDTITLQNGYAKNAPRLVIEFKGVHVGEGKEKWGAEPGKEYLVFSLGKIIEMSPF